jgi:hypothetical protein
MRLKTILVIVTSIVMGVIIAWATTTRAGNDNCNNNCNNDWISIGGGSVRKLVDKDNGIVCWVYAKGYGGGISCVSVGGKK